MPDDPKTRRSHWLLDRRPTRRDAGLAALALAIVLGVDFFAAAGRALGEAQPLGIVVATGLVRIGSNARWLGPALAALALPWLGLSLSPARRRWAVLGFVAAWGSLAGFVGPWMAAKTTAWASSHFAAGATMWSAPATWSWWERAVALTTSVAPGGRLADATILQQCRTDALTVGATLLAMLLMLSPVLRRRAVRLPWWGGLLLSGTCAALFLRLSLSLGALGDLGRMPSLLSIVLIPAAVAGGAWLLVSSAGRSGATTQGRPRRSAILSRAIAGALALLLATIGVAAVRPLSLGKLFVQAGPVGDLAPHASLPVIGGKAELPLAPAGQITVVTYWASWCAPCRAELLWLNDMVEAHGERGLRVLAVNMGEDDATALAFWETSERAFPPVRATRGLLDVLPSGTPASHVIDRQGIVRFSHLGFWPDRTEQYERELIELLDEP